MQKSHLVDTKLQPVWKPMKNLESSEASPNSVAQKLTELWNFKNGIWKLPFLKCPNHSG